MNNIIQTVIPKISSKIKHLIPIIKYLIPIIDKIFFVFHKLDNIDIDFSVSRRGRHNYPLNVLFLLLTIIIKYWYLLFIIIITRWIANKFFKSDKKYSIKSILFYIYYIFCILLGLLALYSLLIMSDYQKLNKFFTLIIFIVVIGEYTNMIKIKKN